MNINDDKIFEKTMMEIGYIGAFYNMRTQAQAIFDFYKKAPRSNDTLLAALLGEVLLLISISNYNAAAEILEKFILRSEAADQEVPAEAKVFLMLVYKKAKKRSDRVKTLLEDIESSGNDTALAAAQELTAN